MNKRYIAVCCCVLALCILAGGCIGQTPTLTGTPTPAPTPVPTLPPAAQERVAEEAQKDALGKTIYDVETHFLQYISFQDIRVYEYADETFMDGTCANTYPEALQGSFEIRFAEDGEIIAAATVLFENAKDGNTIPAGTSRIYADIDSDTRIDDLPFTFEAVAAVSP